MTRKHDAHMTALWVAQCAKREGWKTGIGTTGANVDTNVSFDVPVAQPDRAVTLPWPPSGNTAVRHANGAHYLQPAVIAYRDSVARLVGDSRPVAGRYRLRVDMSPPDARIRDIDNALKSLLDALVKAGYLPSDSMTYMRELVVVVNDDRRGSVTVRAIPIANEPEAA